MSLQNKIYLQRLMSQQREQVKQQPSQGLGDVVKKVTNAIGIPTCNKCEERRKKLNRIFPHGQK